MKVKNIKNHDRMQMTKRRWNNKQIKNSTTPKRKKHYEMQSYTKLGKQRSPNGQIKKTRAHPNKNSNSMQNERK